MIKQYRPKANIYAAEYHCLVLAFTTDRQLTVTHSRKWKKHINVWLVHACGTITQRRIVLNYISIGKCILYLRCITDGER